MSSYDALVSGSPEESASKPALEPALPQGIQPSKSIATAIDRVVAGVVLLGATLVGAVFVASWAGGDGSARELVANLAALGVMTFVAWQALELWNGTTRARTRVRWILTAQVAILKVNATLVLGSQLKLSLPVRLDYEWYSIGKLALVWGSRSGVLVEFAIGPMARLSFDSGVDNRVGLNLLSLAVLAALLYSARLVAAAMQPEPEQAAVPVVRFENGRLLFRLAARKAHAILACWVCVVVLGGALPSLETVDRDEPARDGETAELLAGLQAHCERAEHAACHELGVLYDAGKAVPRDWAVARELYERACNHGVVESCYNLGQMFDRG